MNRWIIFACTLLVLIFIEQPVLAALPVRSAVLFNLSTGQILYEQNAAALVPPASLTKVMTMFLALEYIKKNNISLYKKIRINKHSASTGGSSMHLKAGENVPLVKLLAGMVVPSGNDAAVAVAQMVNPNLRLFVAKMNAKAKSLGMRNTVFKNPSGLPAVGQQTTAYDIMKLARAYLKTYPDALRFHKIRFFLHGGRGLGNTNPLLGVRGVDGLKTGWTVASGYNIIVTAKRDKTRLVAVILGGQNSKIRAITARRMIEAGFLFPSSPERIKKLFAR